MMRTGLIRQAEHSAFLKRYVWRHHYVLTRICDVIVIDKCDVIAFWSSYVDDLWNQFECFKNIASVTTKAELYFCLQN